MIKITCVVPDLPNGYTRLLPGPESVIYAIGPDMPMLRIEAAGNGHYITEEIDPAVSCGNLSDLEGETVRTLPSEEID